MLTFIYFPINSFLLWGTSLHSANPVCGRSDYTDRPKDNHRWVIRGAPAQLATKGHAPPTLRSSTPTSQQMEGKQAAPPLFTTTTNGGQIPPSYWSAAAGRVARTSACTLPGPMRRHGQSGKGRSAFQQEAERGAKGRRELMLHILWISAHGKKEAGWVWGEGARTHPAAAAATSAATAFATERHTNHLLNPTSRQPWSRTFTPPSAAPQLIATLTKCGTAAACVRGQNCYTIRTRRTSLGPFDCWDLVEVKDKPQQPHNHKVAVHFALKICDIFK